MSQKPPLQRPLPEQLPAKPSLVFPPKANLPPGIFPLQQQQQRPVANNSKSTTSSGMSQIKQKIGMNIAELKEAARKAREEAEAETYRMLVVDGGVKRTDQTTQSQSQSNDINNSNNSQTASSSPNNNKSVKGDIQNNNNLSSNNVYPSFIVNFLDNNEVTTNSTSNNNITQEKEEGLNSKVITSHDDSRRRQRVEENVNDVTLHQDVNQNRHQQKHQYNLLWKDALVGGTYWQEEPWFLPGPTFLPNDVREKLRFPSLQQQQQQLNNNNESNNNIGPLAVESLIKLQWLEGSALVSLVRVTPNDQVPHHVIGDQLQIEEVNLSLFPKIHYDEDENNNNKEY